MSLRRVLPAVACVAALVGCGGSSPTGPVGTPSGGGNVIRIVDAGGALQAREATIRGLVESTLTTAGGALGLDGVTVTVTADATQSIAGYGVGGFTPSGQAINLYVDPGFPGLDQILPERLPVIVAHEAHHAARFRGPGYGNTLLEALVSEGLADHFAIELLGAPVAPWSEAFPRSETAAFLEQARPSFDSRNYRHSAWFYGTDPALPLWVGYTLGFRLVESYQAAHPGVTAAQLVDTSADAFRP